MLSRAITRFNLMIEAAVVGLRSLIHGCKMQVPGLPLLWMNRRAVRSNPNDAACMVDVARFVDARTQALGEAYFLGEF
jgi:hypothetical protein